MLASQGTSAGEGVHQPHALQQQEERQRADLPGDHQCGEQDLQQTLASGEAELDGEGIAGRHGEQQRQQRGQRRENGAVGQIAADALRFEQRAIVFERGRTRRTGGNCASPALMNETETIQNAETA